MLRVRVRYQDIDCNKAKVMIFLLESVHGRPIGKGLRAQSISYDVCSYLGHHTSTPAVTATRAEHAVDTKHAVEPSRILLREWPVGVEEGIQTSGYHRGHVSCCIWHVYTTSLGLGVATWLCGVSDTGISVTWNRTKAGVWLLWSTCIYGSSS